ncbi:MAG: hypothetical protein DIU63_06700 [Proteobacteria bacterium]|jgi:uncharacterized protein YjiS (DUF1127 family)|nr:MAG: hypothetical protein DIU63_06700 [Pseudomonadota bacterium]
MAASHGWEINSPIRQSFLGKVRWASHFALKTYLRWYQQRAAAHYLAQLDDRMLHDIGITRSQIESAVRNGRDRNWLR